MQIDELSHTAASSARRGLDMAIEEIEKRVKIKLNDISDESQLYFSKQRDAELKAIAQIKSLRALFHKREFESFLEEYKF